MKNSEVNIHPPSNVLKIFLLIVWTTIFAPASNKYNTREGGVSVSGSGVWGGDDFLYPSYPEEGGRVKKLHKQLSSNQLNFSTEFNNATIISFFSCGIFFKKNCAALGKWFIIFLVTYGRIFSAWFFSVLNLFSRLIHSCELIVTYREARRSDYLLIRGFIISLLR